MGAWGAAAARARKAGAAVDASRLDHLARLLRQTGVADRASTTRAHVIYWAYLGNALSQATIEGDALEQVIDELAAMAMRNDGG